MIKTAQIYALHLEARTARAQVMNTVEKLRTVSSRPHALPLTGRGWRVGPSGPYLGVNQPQPKPVRVGRVRGWRRVVGFRGRGSVGRTGVLWHWNPRSPLLAVQPQTGALASLCPTFPSGHNGDENVPRFTGFLGTERA